MAEYSNRKPVRPEEASDENRDPITDAPGAHPVGTGIGAAGGGAAGAAIGAAGGPAGAAIGAAVGAVAGGLAGKGVAESIDPTAEEAYWRENHQSRPYVDRGAVTRITPRPTATAGRRAPATPAGPSTRPSRSFPVAGSRPEGNADSTGIAPVPPPATPGTVSPRTQRRVIPDARMSERSILDKAGNRSGSPDSRPFPCRAGRIGANPEDPDFVPTLWPFPMTHRSPRDFSIESISSAAVVPAASTPSSEIPESRLRPLIGKPEGSLVIHEIYRSLQGESTHAGLPCVFVRLTACHLRCRYCDTPHAFHQGQVMSLEELLDAVRRFPDRLVEVTGGEPLLQPEVFPLMSRLADLGKSVLLETSGAIDIRPVDPRVRIILDLKTPGSGEADAMFWPNLDQLKPVDELKVIICDRDDFEWSLEVIRRHGLIERVPILVGPAFGRVAAEDLASWVLASGLPLRMQLQLHKLIWEPDRRGV